MIVLWADCLKNNLISLWTTRSFTFAHVICLVLEAFHHFVWDVHVVILCLGQHMPLPLFYI